VVVEERSYEMSGLALACVMGSICGGRCLSRTRDFAIFYVIGQKYGIKIWRPAFLDRTSLRVIVDPFPC
jgi:hypothetical protein